MGGGGSEAQGNLVVSRNCKKAMWLEPQGWRKSVVQGAVQVCLEVVSPST